jgi:hydrogenase maturation protease
MDVRIIGLGNVLMADEGWGCYVLKVLDATYAFPPDVTLVDAGSTPGRDIVPYLVDADVAIIVDAVKAPEPPGTVKVYDRGVLVTDVPQPRVCPHDNCVRPALVSLGLAGHGPRDVVLVGLVPEWRATGPHLSEPARRAVPIAIECVLSQLERLGLRPHLKPGPHVPDIWWEEVESLAGIPARPGR